MEIKEFKKVVDNYFSGNNWQHKVCPICYRNYFTKYNFDTCMSHFCSKSYEFLKYSPKRVQLTPKQLWEKTKAFFENYSIRIVNRNDIVNKIGDTLFIVASLQYFDKAIHKNMAPETGIYFVPQPSIRLKYLDKVTKREGISTSFINIATEQANASVEEYANHLDIWFDYFSAIGIFVNQMTVILQDKLWKKGVFTGHSLLFSYGGLHLGDATYIYDVATRLGKDSLTIIDFGFGFERILWAVNKNQSYYTLIGPLIDAINQKHRLIDLIRTATLMAMSGVSPSNKSHGFRLRKLIKIVSCEYLGTDITHILVHSYKYWSNFIQPVFSVEATLHILQLELYRCTNAEICKRLNIRVTDRNLDVKTEDFLLSLLSRGIKFDELHYYLSRSFPELTQ